MTAPRAMSCPLCGGALAPPSESRRLVCNYCGRSLLYVGEGFLPRYVIPPRLTEEDHRSACRKLFRNPLVAKALGGSAVLLKHQRVYVPFYLLTGKRGGVLAVGRERVVAKMPGSALPDENGPGFGAVAMARYQRSKPEIRVEEDSRVVLGEFRYMYPAAVLENWDMVETDLRDVVLAHAEESTPATLNDLAREGDVVDVDIPLERIVEKGVGSGLETKGELKVLEMQVTLVYVPVASFTFRYGNDIFTVVREEVEGRWLAGQLPFRKDWARLLALPIVAGLGFVAGNLAAFLGGLPRGSWESSPGSSKAVVIASLIVGSVLALGLQAAWIIMRTPYVVRLAPGGLRVEGAGAPPKNPFAPFNVLASFLVKAMFQRSSRTGWLE